MMSSARLVMRERLPLREWKYEIMVRPFCHCVTSLRWTMPYGMVKSFLNPHLYRERRLAGMVAERWSWMFDELRCSGTLWRYTLRWLLARARIRMKSPLT